MILRRISLFAFGFVIGFAGNGCMKHVSADSSHDLVHRGSYAYQRLNDGEFLVAAVDDIALRKAFAEIGCGTKYICEAEHDGDLYTVEVHAK